MALVRSTQVKPKVRLSQAITLFENDLSSEQKMVLHSYKFQLRNSAPDASDVMRLTAEIDFAASTKVKGRCFGPRLTNVLQTVQMFTALGDVAVGSSQNIIAGSVWSLVRMSLLSIVNFLPYFDKLSSLLMAVGRSSPRYQELALYYQGSQRLQSYLCEYLVVVVDLCRHIHSFSRKSNLGKFLSAQLDPNINKYESDLKLWGESIEKEFHFEVAKATNTESHKNSLFRATFTRDHDINLAQQKKKARMKIPKACSTYDHVKTWKKTRKAGTTSILRNHTKYKRWKSREYASTIICSGKLGSGKSVLLANVVDDLYLSNRSPDTVVAFFFCRHDVAESLFARTVIGSLARQLLSTISDVESGTQLHEEDRPSFDLEDIKALLQRIIPSECKAFFVLDGLDECEVEERDVLINVLRELQKSFCLSLCISARVAANDALNLSLKALALPIVFKMPTSNPDIASFVESELTIALESERLFLGNPDLILDIRNTLSEGSQGMFLWAVLQMELLYEMHTDEDIRQALLDLPKDLTETFSRILQRSARKSEKYQRRILDLVSAAFRPLKTEELREALSVVHGDTEWNPSRILNDVRSALSSCGSLLVIDEEDYSVQFVHQSVKQFLRQWNNRVPSESSFLGCAHQETTNTTVTYLNYSIFETQLSVKNVPKVTARSALSTIVDSTTESKLIRSYALRLLKSSPNIDHNIYKTLQEHKNDRFKHISDEQHLYHYAKQYWMQHLKSLLLVGVKLEPKILQLVATLLRKEWAETTTPDDRIQALLSTAIENRDHDFVHMLLALSEIEFKFNDIIQEPPLFQALRLGDAAVVKLLLDTGQVDVNLQNSKGLTPFHFALEKRDAKIMSLLLGTNEIELDLVANFEKSPLFLALERDDLSVANFLLATGKMDINSLDYLGRAPLCIAAQNGHESIVRNLLKIVTLDVNHRDTLGRTPLFLAVKHGHVEVVRLLLATKKVDVNSQDRQNRTPLSYAVFHVHQMLTELLLATREIDVNSKDTRQRTPLWYAIGVGHIWAVKLLLENDKTDVNSKDARQGTPLSHAIGVENNWAVKLLLENEKVDVNSKDIEGYTPLMLAVLTGNKSVVELLLQTGNADIGSKTNKGQTALDLAIEHKQDSIIEVLKPLSDFKLLRVVTRGEKHNDLEI